VPVSRMQKSMKVPPISTPIRQAIEHHHNNGPSCPNRRASVQEQNRADK
jgi:hypothetical protein